MHTFFMLLYTSLLNIYDNISTHRKNDVYFINVSSQARMQTHNIYNVYMKSCILHTNTYMRNVYLSHMTNVVYFTLTWEMLYTSQTHIINIYFLGEMYTRHMRKYLPPFSDRLYNERDDYVHNMVAPQLLAGGNWKTPLHAHRWQWPVVNPSTPHIWQWPVVNASWSYIKMTSGQCLPACSR